MTSDRSADWSRLPGSRLAWPVGVALLLAAGVTAALANFVAWYMATGLGALSGGASLCGGILLQRRNDQQAREAAWQAVTTTAPGASNGGRDDPKRGPTVMTLLLPGRRAVPYTLADEHRVRALLRWADGQGSIRERVLYLDGAPGSGKTRLLVEFEQVIPPPGRCGWVIAGRGAAACDSGGQAGQTGCVVH